MDSSKITNVNRRKKYLVNKSLQYNILGKVLVITSIVAVAFVFALGLFYFSAHSGDLIANDNLFFYDSESGRFSPFAIIIIFCILLILFALIILRMTHRIAGPVYRLKKIMNTIAEGNFDIPEIKFRKYDEFQDVADDFNKMLSKINSRHNGIKNQIQSIKQDIEKSINDGSIPKNESQIKDYLSVILENLSKIEKL